jgi:ribosome-associated protein
VSAPPGMLDIGALRPLPCEELTFRYTRSSGPGGQHVNTSATRAELVFDLDGSPTLTEEERARARRRLSGRLDGDGRVRVVAQDERSQRRNRDLAIARFRALMRDALAPPPPPRRKTRPGRQAVERRLAGKRARGDVKALRRRVRPDD